MLEDKLNQHLRQALDRVSVSRITVELEEAFGDSNNNFIEIPRGFLVCMEYADGLLVLDYYETFVCADKTHAQMRTTQLIATPRIRRIYFDDDLIPSRLPFPRLHNIPISSI